MKNISPNPRGFGIIGLIIILVIVGVVGTIGFFVYHKNSTKSVKSVNVKIESKQTEPTPTPSATPTVTQTVAPSAKTSASTAQTNNPSAPKNTTVTEQTVNCSDQVCFEKKFAECKPATFTAGFGEDINTAQVVAYYTINGTKGNGCNMAFRYTKNPNKTWENKELTCNWDNKKAFQDSIEQTFNDLDSYGCEGALLPILKG